MNKFNQAKSTTNPTDNQTNKPDNDFTQIINGVTLTLGYDPHNYFNLSILAKQRLYQTDARGYYDKNKPILDPLEWIKSEAGQKHISQIYNNSKGAFFASHYQDTEKAPTTIYTRSFYIWLGYLKHCIGNIDTAISAELEN